MASITTVAGERFLALAGLDRAEQIAHRVGEADGLLGARAEHKTIAGAVAHAHFLAGEGRAAVIGKPAGKFADGHLHD